jgi:hypothetical protein
MSERVVDFVMVSLLIVMLLLATARRGRLYLGQ